VTVEEVATLASRFGWSYETLMAMSGLERRLWLRAADAVTQSPRAGSGSASARGTGASAEQRQDPRPPQLTEAERRARLLEVAKGFAARYQR
jgi:hypothetical protein